jgi:hypothetical protein
VPLPVIGQARLADAVLGRDAAYRAAADECLLDRKAIRASADATDAHVLQFTRTAGQAAPEFREQGAFRVFPVDGIDGTLAEQLGQTQQAIADELGWSRGQVSNYVLLQKIDPKAWAIIATTVRDSELPRYSDDVATSATGVARFTENLLRVLPPLTPARCASL